jgi:hypothetical protein
MIDEPHIFGWAFVAFFIIFRSVLQSRRREGSSIRSMNAETLALVALVFSSDIEPLLLVGTTGTTGPRNFDACHLL